MVCVVPKCREDAEADELQVLGSGLWAPPALRCLPACQVLIGSARCSKHLIIKSRTIRAFYFYFD